MDMKYAKIYTFFIIAMLGIVSFFPVKAAATLRDEDVLQAIEGIVQWKKQQMGIAEQSPLLSGPFLEYAGETMGDWYPIGLGRIGYEDDYPSYLAVLQHNVKKRYQQEHQLSETKATEWHRISLAMLAAGGDPTNVQGINLIADGTYNRDKKVPLGAQGLNGLIWGLITVDSMRYSVPADAALQRQQLIAHILSFQLDDGGFSFYQSSADADITAMAIQALAPYYNSNEVFTYVKKQTGAEVTTTVRQVIDEALNALLALQQEDGGFASWEDANVESAAQVLVALSTLGIDVQQDSRFIKSQSILQNIMTFQQDDGGFVHAKQYNASNPTSKPDESNTMASEQVLYALVAYYRLQHDYRALYDFRAEQDDALKQQIVQLEEAIAALSVASTKENVIRVLAQYEAIPEAERSYVHNAHLLLQLIDTHSIVFNEEPYTTAYNIHTSGAATITPILSEHTQPADITEAQLEKLSALLKSGARSTQYVETVALLQQFEQATNAASYTKQIEQLRAHLIEVEVIQQEIDAINEEVLAHLYPFEALTLSDEQKVAHIMKRFNALAKEDQQKVLNVEDLRKSEAQLESLKRERIVKIALFVVMMIALVIVVIRIRKRRKEHL